MLRDFLSFASCCKCSHKIERSCLHAQTASFNVYFYYYCEREVKLFVNALLLSCFITSPLLHHHHSRRFFWLFQGTSAKLSHNFLCQVKVTKCNFFFFFFRLRKTKQVSETTRKGKNHRVVFSSFTNLFTHKIFIDDDETRVALSIVRLYGSLGLPPRWRMCNHNFLRRVETSYIYIDFFDLVWWNYNKNKSLVELNLWEVFFLLLLVFDK